MLLILAVVAIGTVQNNGIIDHAKNARDEYGKAGVNENTTLQNYLDKIKDNIPTGVGTGTGNGGTSDEGNNQGGETVKDCEKCENGYITGVYVCENYLKGCNAISSSYKELYGGACRASGCNYEYIGETAYGAMDCPECKGEDTIHVEDVVAYKLSECDHSPKTLNDEVSHPCPDCLITFTIDEKTYKAALGMTWRQWIESDVFDKGSIKGLHWYQNETTYFITYDEQGKEIVSDSDSTPIIDGGQYYIVGW